MFRQFVCFVTAVAVVACPLWCGNGPCCADDASVEQTGAPACCRSNDRKPVCCQTARSGPIANSSKRTELRIGAPENPPVSPLEFPGSGCQGVCGGAVRESDSRSFEIDVASGLVIQKADRDDRAPTLRPTSAGFGLFEDRPVESGRSLRARIASLLC